MCARYVEYLIQEKAEESAAFHNRLAELYLTMSMSARRRGDSGMHPDFTLIAAVAVSIVFIDCRRSTSHERQTLAFH